MLLTYTILVFLSGLSFAWALLSYQKFRVWAQRETTKSFMINLIAGLLLAALTGGFALHAASSGAVTGTSRPAPTPSASVPSTTPTLGTRVPTAPPTVAPNSLDLPAALVGTWKGTAHEFSPSGDFAVVLTLRPGQVGSVVGQIDRPSLNNCHLFLELDKVTGQSIETTENQDPASSSELCYFDGAVISRPGTKMAASVSGNSLDWKEAEGSLADSPTATATLTKTS